MAAGGTRSRCRSSVTKSAGGRPSSASAQHGSARRCGSKTKASFGPRSVASDSRVTPARRRWSACSLMPARATSEREVEVVDAHLVLGALAPGDGAVGDVVPGAGELHLVALADGDA